MMSFEPDNLNILIVDDTSANLKTLAAILSERGYQVRPCTNGEIALNAVRKKLPDLILLDIRMPDIDGYEVCRRLKEDKHTRDIPVIFISALDETMDMVKGFNLGAVDYITKPVETEELLSRVKTHLTIACLQRELNKTNTELEERVSARTAELSESNLSLKKEIAERKLAEDNLRQSEKKFKDFMMSANEGFVLFDADLNLSEINNKALEIFPPESTKENLLGKNILNIAPNLKETGRYDKYVTVRDTGEPLYFSDIIPDPKFGDRHLSIKAFKGGEGLGIILSDITERIKMAEELRRQLDQINKLQQRIQAESIYLQEEIKSEHNFENIIGNSDSLKYVLYRVAEVAPTDAPVLISGETGTGKELIARAIHNASSRNKYALVKVNCAALPVSLIESELFGHEKGAFTGADVRRMGRFQLADGATLFLDEISEIPLELQAKLLQVLQDGEFELMGSSKTIRTDVRIIAASNRNLKDEVNHGRFRQDLFYRINVFPLTVPPLRNRKEDIPLLVNWFVGRFNRKMGKNITSIPAALIKHLQANDWPGNVRELENVIERAVITSKNSILKLADRLATSASELTTAKSNKTLAEMEREHILNTLENTGWKIEGTHGAADVLGLAPSTLRGRMKKLEIYRSM